MVFKGLLQTSIPPLISTFYPKVQLCLGTENFRWGMLVFQKSFGVEFFWKIGVSRFCPIYLSHTAKNFRRGALLCFRMFRVSNSFMPRRGISRLFSKKKCCFTVPKKIVGTIQCIGKIRVSEKLCKGGITIFRWKCLSHSAEKNRRRTYLCLTNFCYPEILMIKAGREGVSQFSV